MECNRDEAFRAKEIAEKKFMAKDVAGAKKFALKAQALYPGLDGISQMIDTLNVHAAAEALINGERDWYAILCVTASADEEMLKKQYRKLALLLHPDKNKSVGAEAAFKLVSEAWSVLSDKTRRMAYDMKRNIKVNQQRAAPGCSSQNSYHHSAKTAASNVKTQKSTARPASSVFPPTCPQQSSTFWTTCRHCNMQYEYFKVYLNVNLLCPSCNEPFLAVDTGNPTGESNPSKPLGSRQQTVNQPKTSFAHGKFSSSIPGMGSTGFQHRTNIGSFNKRNYQSSASSKAAETQTTPGSVPTSVDAATMLRETYEKMKREGKFDDGTVEKTVQNEVHASKRPVSGIPVGKTHASFSGNATDLKDPTILRQERSFKKRKGDNSTSNYVADGLAKGTGVGHGGKNINQNTNATKLDTNSTCGDFGKAKVSHRQMGSFKCNFSQTEFRNMLMQKAKTLIRKKLDDYRIIAATKLSEKEAKQKQKQKQRENDKENESAHLNVNTNDELKMGKSKNHITQASGDILSTENNFDGSAKEDEGPVSIDVPDPEFYIFDNDRSESSFESDKNQVWATYDDEDGMPRYYAMVQRVLSKKPFRIRMSFLNSRTNSEFSSLNWVGMGFAKSCGEFRVGRYESCNRINMFSHRVKVENIKGVFRVVPRKGDIWALYKNWSLQWNEHTPDDIIYKYDMVEVLDDYNEEQGVSVIPLLKRVGFKAVFYRHPDQKEIRTIPREEMFRFSHQVPYYLLTGEETQNAPKGCYELDPAAMPLELLQVTTDAKDEELVQSPDDNLKI